MEIEGAHFEKSHATASETESIIVPEQPPQLQEKTKETNSDQLQPKKPRKKRGSKYDEPVKKRLQELVDSLNNDIISQKEYSSQITLDGMANYLKDQIKFEANISSIEYVLTHRCEPWKNRQDILKNAIGNKPPSIDECFDLRELGGTGRPGGMRDMSQSSEKYDTHVEQFLTTTHMRLLKKEVMKEEYLSIVEKLTPKVVATWIQRNIEDFSDVSIDKIEIGVLNSAAWRNREHFLNTDMYI